MTSKLSSATGGTLKCVSSNISSCYIRSQLVSFGVQKGIKVVVKEQHVDRKRVGEMQLCVEKHINGKLKGVAL